jgi:hypothetical protein
VVPPWLLQNKKSFLIENPPNPGLMAIKKGGFVKNKCLEFKGHIKGQLFTCMYV